MFDISHYIHTGLLTPLGTVSALVSIQTQPRGRPQGLYLTRVPPASNPDREIKPP
jgi:hypothetical protein